MKKLSAIPIPEYAKLLPDELNKEMYFLSQNNSSPTNIRLLLSKFFRRKISNLQHKKYKMLQRYARFAKSSKQIDRLGLVFDNNISRLLQEIDLSSRRLDKLEFYDNYDESQKLIRPDATNESGDKSLFKLPY